MSITITREPIGPDDAPRAPASSRLGGVIRLKSIGGALVVAGGVAATATALRLPGSACLIGTIAIALTIVFAWLAVTLIGDVGMWRALREGERSIAEVHAAGQVEVVRLTPDAAWDVAAIDDDADAVLLRCGDRFLYLNMELGDAIDEGSDSGKVNDDGDTPARRMRVVTAIRRWPPPVGDVLEVVLGDAWLPLGSLSRVDLDDPRLQAIAGRADWMAAVLDRDELPEGWRAAIAA